MKFDQKSTHIYSTKTGHILTTKRGDSGSACFLEIKCVMNQAPNLDTKSDKKHVNEQKINKNDQKSRKVKIIKNMKIRKSEKVTKSRKSKIIKMLKSENAKTVKNDKKCTPPQNGQNVT